MKLFPVLLVTLACWLTAHARPWSEDVIYFVLTDRFYDGDPANNLPEGGDSKLFDPEQKNINLYHGGDLRGLELALKSGYFNELGVTALWITPPLKNVWRSGYDHGGWKTGYHGYWTQDFLDIDPRLTSRESLSGAAYPDSADGRMRHFRDFVRLAHSKGIKVVQDVVLNHAGPVFYYDSNGNETFDRNAENEWVLPYKQDGFYDNTRWPDVPEWNMRRTEPTGSRKLLGRRVATTGILANPEVYGRKGFSWESLGKSNGEEVMCDFFSLRDFYTDPNGKYFDQLVNEFVTIYEFYMEDIGIDGLRVDTVKHVHHEFWDAFTERLRRRLGSAAREKIIFGEVYDGNPAKLGQYTWRADAAENPEPCLDSLLAFQLCFAMRDYLRRPGNEFGTGHQIEGAMRAFSDGRFEDGRHFFNRTPGADGLNSLQKSITFVENHDGINRFRAKGVTERRHQLAQAMVMTLPGIPCLYYGAEVGQYDEHGRIGQDGETGRMTLWKRDAGPTLASLKRNETFAAVSKLAALRKQEKALRDGEFRPLWTDSGEMSEDDGIFAFARVMPDPKDSLVVVFNLSAGESKTGPLGLGSVFPQGAEAEGEVVIGEPKTLRSGMQLAAPANSMVIYRPVAAE